MRLRSKLLIAGFLSAAVMVPALADINYTQGAGTVIFAFTCFSTKVCPAHTLVNSSGTEIGNATTPVQVSLANTGANGTAVAVSAASLPLPTGAATSANQSTEITSLNTIAANTGAPVPLGSASAGLTPKLLNALSTTVTSIKASAAGQLYMLHCGNSGAAVAFVQIFDVATSGGVTLGTTVPVMSFEIDAGISAGFAESLVGIQFANGIQVAATTTATGLTAPGTALNCNAAFK